MHADASGHAVLGPDEGEVLEVRDARLVIKVASDSQLICDYEAPPHFPGPPLHVHPGYDEAFVVLEGRLELDIRDRRSQLEPGSVAYVRGDVPHTFRNPTGERARFLAVCSPGGFEDYFRALARGDEQAIAEVSERFGYAPVEYAAAG